MKRFMYVTSKTNKKCKKLNLNILIARLLYQSIKEKSNYLVKNNYNNN